MCVRAARPMTVNRFVRLSLITRKYRLPVGVDGLRRGFTIIDGFIAIAKGIELPDRQVTIDMIKSVLIDLIVRPLRVVILGFKSFTAQSVVHGFDSINRNR